MNSGDRGLLFGHNLHGQRYVAERSGFLEARRRKIVFGTIGVPKDGLAGREGYRKISLTLADKNLDHANPPRLLSQIENAPGISAATLRPTVL
jgi:hypothetical protein